MVAAGGACAVLMNVQIAPRSSVIPVYDSPVVRIDVLRGRQGLQRVAAGLLDRLHALDTPGLAVVGNGIPGEHLVQVVVEARVDGVCVAVLQVGNRLPIVSGYVNLPRQRAVVPGRRAQSRAPSLPMGAQASSDASLSKVLCTRSTPPASAIALYCIHDKTAAMGVSGPSSNCSGPYTLAV